MSRFINNKRTSCRFPRSSPSKRRDTRLWGLHGGARSASIGDEAPLSSGAFGCSASKPPFPLVGDRKQIPRPWSAGCLQLPVRPRPFAFSFRVCSPPSCPTENPPLPSGPSEKMVARARPRHFRCGIRTILIRRIPTCDICSAMTHLVGSQWR